MFFKIVLIKKKGCTLTYSYSLHELMWQRIILSLTLTLTAFMREVKDCVDPEDIIKSFSQMGKEDHKKSSMVIHKPIDWSNKPTTTTTTTTSETSKVVTTTITTRHGRSSSVVESRHGRSGTMIETILEPEDEDEETKTDVEQNGSVQRKNTLENNQKKTHVENGSNQRKNATENGGIKPQKKEKVEKAAFAQKRTRKKSCSDPMNRKTCIF